MPIIKIIYDIVYNEQEISLLEEYNTCIHRIIMSFEKKYDNSENSLQEKAEFEKEFHKIIKDYLQLRQFINENEQ